MGDAAMNNIPVPSAPQFEEDAVDTTHHSTNFSFEGASPDRTANGAENNDSEAISQQSSDNEYEDSEHSEFIWLSRAQSRVEEIRRLFNLPSSENICDEFVCALRKRVLLQGRLYICEHFICFHSNLFGYSKDKVIPLKEVTNVRKRRHCGFPNSIEILWRGGKREFLTSFLSRDEAYRLVMIAWHNNSGYAKLFGAVSVEAAVRCALPLLHGKKSHAYTAPEGGSPRSSSPGHEEPALHSDGEAKHEGKRNAASRLGQAFGQLAKASMHMSDGERPITRRRRRKPSRKAEGGAVSADDISSQASANSLTKGQRLKHVVPREESAASLAESEISVDAPDSHDDDSEASDGDGVAEWDPQPGGAPTMAPGMTKIAEGMLDADVKEVYSRLLADQRFFRTFLEGRDDKEVRVSDWRQHPIVGRLREVSFVSAVKRTMGISPPFAHCHQTQRYRVFEGGQHVVFESSQTMNDIPFGDHFTVESRWDFSAMQPRPDGTHQTLAVNHVYIPFAKHTMWKKAIIKGTLDTCREVHEDMLAKAQQVVAAVPTALARIRSLKSSLEAIPSLSEGGGTPFMSGTPSANTTDEGQSLDEILNKLSPEYRADVARMLIRSASKALPDPRQRSGNFSRAASGRLRTADLPRGFAEPGRQGSRHMLQDYIPPLGGLLQLKYILSGAALLLIITLQVFILLGWSPGQRSGQRAPPEMWAQRMEMMQLELGALTQRVEALSGELRAAAEHLATTTLGDEGGPGT